MASHKENDDILMLPISDSSSSSRLANTSSTIDGLHSSTVVLSYTGPLQTQRSGKSGMCNDPYCTTCPSHYNHQAAQIPTSIDPATFDSPVPKITNPHSKVAQNWKEWFALASLLPIFLDPLFVFLIRVKKDDKCLFIDWTLAYSYVAIKTLMDVLVLVYILHQCRLPYIEYDSTVGGDPQLVSHPIKIALRYLRGKFRVDVIVVLPLAQIFILWLIPAHLGASGANYAENAILIQYIPKLFRLLPLLSGFGSNWAHVLINLCIFMIASHFVGSCWYLFGLQRVNQCLRDACGSNFDRACRELIDCGHGTNKTLLAAWKDNANSSACFQEDGFQYGIYLQAVSLTHDSSPFTRYIYSLFWGFQQISTLAGNQVPSKVNLEVLFTMGIVGLGLFLFAFLIGNMQDLIRRNLEMTLRQRKVEQWMRYEKIPKHLRERIHEAEQFNWVATRGVNEEMLLENMPDDIQRDIRRHLFRFFDKVSIFSEMDEPVRDAINERLKQKRYTEKSTAVFHRGGRVDKMIFIVSGKMESIGEDNFVLHLSKGDVCGEELLTWVLELSSTNSDETRARLPSKGLLSKRTVRCVKKVEAFSLSVKDLEEVMSLFPGFPRINSIGLEIPKETTS